MEFLAFKNKKFTKAIGFVFKKGMQPSCLIRYDLIFTKFMISTSTLIHSTA
jgi:hypothetical protein